MNTSTDIIYLVTPTHGYWDDMLEGFAIDPKGIEQLVRSQCTKLTEVQVNMANLTVVVVPQDGYEQTWYIREIEKITCE